MNATYSTPMPPEVTHHVLLVDDDPRQLKLNRLRLEAEGYAVETAVDADGALRQARRNPPDVILSDVLLGSIDGFAFCRMARSEPELTNVPIVLISGHVSDSEEDAYKLAKRVGASALLNRSDDFEPELAALREAVTAPSTPRARRTNRSMYEQHLRTNGQQMSRLIDEARGAEERYRTVFEHANDTITLLSRDGTILEANKRWSSVLGYEPVELVGKNIAAFAAAGASEANTARFMRALTGASGVIPRVPLAHASGSIVLMDFSVSMIALSGQSYVLSVGHDVTEQVEANQVIANAEARYRTLVERLPDVIWTCRADGALTFVTDNARSVLGYGPDELYVESSDQRVRAVHPDDRDVVAQAFAALRLEGRGFDIEYRRQHKDGRWIWLRNRSTATYAHDGERYVEGMISDVSERRRLEESLRQAQKMEAIGQLAGGLAHDFNNILATILANSCFLIDALPGDTQQREDAVVIKVAAERAAALTRQLLALGRRQMFELRVASLHDVVKGFEKMLRRLISEDIALAVTRDRGMALVRVDIGQIEQVIMNLVVNARDAMAGGGELSLRTYDLDLDEGQAAHHALGAGSYAVLEVRDTGCGMSAEIQRQIFEPFFTTKGPNKGTGLGLSTCYGIVKQSNGHITVDSEPGKGTTFRVYLPRVDEAPEALGLARMQRGATGHETVIVIEDDARVRSAVTRILETRGFDVLVARDGADACEIAKARDIDLVLSDLVMPGMSGIEVVTEIRARAPGVKALFMSGYSDHAVLENQTSKVGHGFLQKPFSPDALVARIREILDAGAASA